MNSNSQSYLRLLHSVPQAPAVDVYLNNKLVADKLTYRSFTDYFSVTADSLQIKVYSAADKQLLLSTTADIPDNTIFTFSLVGQLPNINLLTIEDPRIPIQPTRAYFRFGHLAPTAPAVDVTFADGTELFKNISYQQVTDYISLSPGTYTLELRPAGTDQVVLYVPNITLTPNRFFSGYAVGLVSDEPSLQLLIPLDGNSYIEF